MTDWSNHALKRLHVESVPVNAKAELSISASKDHMSRPVRADNTSFHRVSFFPRSADPRRVPPDGKLPEVIHLVRGHEVHRRVPHGRENSR